MNIFKKLFKSSDVEQKNMGLTTLTNGYVLDGFNGFSFDGLYEDNKLINEGFASNTDVYAVLINLVK